MAMSEKLLRVLLSELATVRLCCAKKNCNTVVELPTDSLDRSVSSGACPACGTSFHVIAGSEESDHLSNLARAVRGLANTTDRVRVEFVIPQKD